LHCKALSDCYYCVANVISFLCGEGGRSRDPLSISGDLLAKVLSYHQVIPEYLDFISTFGGGPKASNQRFSAFKQQCVISDPPQLQCVDRLPRSGRQYQICYNLCSVWSNSTIVEPPSHNNWYTQQAAFHHQFDIATGHSLWITTKGDLEIMKRIRIKYNERRGSPQPLQFYTAEDSFIASLDIHLIHCQWASERWTWCLQWLEDIVHQLVCQLRVI
jgi:hypothetical protein